MPGVTLTSHRSLTIVDESDQHAGHAGSRMLGNTSGETHFRISIVSPTFDGLNTVKRHRMVYEVSTCKSLGHISLRPSRWHALHAHR